MTLLTFFSAPKPFTDPHIATIQRNAIRSWTLLEDSEVILLGGESGLAEIARELDVKHFPNVRVNDSGVPLISSMFEIARENSDSDLLCIVNADMILMPDFVEAARQAAKLKNKFVLLSQRWDLDVTQPLDFSADWASRLRSSVLRQGSLHRPAGSDFFLFPRSCYADVPDFVIGRAGWDNWMIYKARKEGWPVIDCTPSVTIVHQNHDYSHLPGGRPHYDLAESQQNMQLGGGRKHMYMVLDADRQLRGGKICPPRFNWLRLIRSIELRLMPESGELRGPQGELTRRLRKLRRKLAKEI